MEAEDNSKREQLLLGMQNLPITSQIEKLKARIDMIAAACKSAEKVLADTRKAYQFGTRQGPTILPTLDKGQAAKIQEQENLLRTSVNFGEGLRVPADQRQVTSALPVHLAYVLPVGDGMHGVSDSSGMYMKSTPPLSSNSMSNPGPLLQSSGTPLIARSAASPSTTATSFDNTTTSPLPYANSPRSGTGMMNTPSPQQQNLQPQQQQPQQQQQRPKMMPLHQQQILAQQQFRQSTMQTLGQNQLSQLHDLQSQGQPKFQQLQYSQPLGSQQFQNRQLAGHVQAGLGQSQLNSGTQLNRHLGQFAGNANTALFSAAQSNQMIPNMSGAMSSQPLVARTQYGLAGSNLQRTHPSQILNDQMFNMGVSNAASMMPIQPQQQQQLGSQGGFGNMAQNAQNLQPSIAALQNVQQNLQNYGQQRPPNQQ